MAFIEQLRIEDLAVAIFFLGLYGAMSQRSIVKTIMSVGIMDIGAITFFMMANFPEDARPPVAPTPAEQMADPVPQALMITAIVIGVSVIAMCLAMYMRVAYRYGTADWNILIRRLDQ
ncbi:MAG: sodium:proton antiporter [Spirochaetota bacterium]